MQFQAHNPQTRTATVSLLFALVVRASEVARNDGENAFAKTVLKLLPTFQSVFVKSLSDPKSKQLSRECSCRGLAACFGLSKTEGVAASDALNESLLKAFGQTTNHGGSAMMETREQEALRRIQNAETEAEGRDAINNFLEQDGRGNEVVEGGAVGVSEAALGAYREMASAAIAVGGSGGRENENVLYYLICLSTTLPVWALGENASRYSAGTLLRDGEVSRDGAFWFHRCTALKLPFERSSLAL